MPVPVVIDHIARVKPSEGLQQAGFQLLLDLLKAKTRLGQSERRGQDLQYEGAFLLRPAVHRSDSLRSRGHRRRA